GLSKRADRRRRAPAQRPVERGLAGLVRVERIGAAREQLLDERRVTHLVERRPHQGCRPRTIADGEIGAPGGHRAYEIDVLAHHRKQKRREADKGALVRVRAALEEATCPGDIVVQQRADERRLRREVRNLRARGGGKRADDDDDCWNSHDVLLCVAPDQSAATPCSPAIAPPPLIWIKKRRAGTTPGCNGEDWRWRRRRPSWTSDMTPVAITAACT